MGVFRKLKDIFYDEEIIEEEIKEEKPVIKEVKRENVERRSVPEIKRDAEPLREEVVPKYEQPVKKEIKNEDVIERDLYQSKQTFKFPILEDDEDLEQRRMSRSRRSSTNVMEVERRNKEIKRKEEPKQVVKPKVFKPSPVISPVYGILDKNFDREEIIKKSKEASRSKAINDIDYDSVRKKAYGNVEEEASCSLNNKGDASKVLKNVNEIEEELEKVKNDNSIESLLESIEENANFTIGDLEKRASEVEDITGEISLKEVSRLDKYKDKEENKERKKLDDIGDQTLEHDLFNLIDSMYEEEE